MEQFFVYFVPHRLSIDLTRLRCRRPILQQVRPWYARPKNSARCICQCQVCNGLYHSISLTGHTIADLLDARLS